MWDDELTPEERNTDYLRDKPHVECALWEEWVIVVCNWEKIANPTLDEWAALRSKFYHGKMPIRSVEELKALRAQYLGVKE